MKKRTGAFVLAAAFGVAGSLALMREALVSVRVDEARAADCAKKAPDACTAAETESRARVERRKGQNRTSSNVPLYLPM